MAKKTQVVITCDVHDGIAEAVGTIRFAVEGTSFEFELCDAHLDEFRTSMESWSAHARRVGRSGSTTGSSRSRAAAGRGGTKSKAADGGPSSADIRAWASSRGMDVPTRGRISADLRAAFDAAKRA